MIVCNTLRSAALVAATTTAAASAPLFGATGDFFADPYDVSALFDFVDTGTDGVDLALTIMDLGGTTGVMSGELLLSDDGAVFLSTSTVQRIDAAATGVSSGSFTVYFVPSNGTLAPRVRGNLTVRVDYLFDPEEGAHFGTSTVTIKGALAPIPLPATLPLLGGTLLAVSANARRRSPHARLQNYLTAYEN